GTGKVASFSSAFSGTWLRGMSDDAKNLFQNNVMNTLKPSSDNDYPFIISTEIRGGFAHVEITTPNVHKSASAEVAVTLPDGSELSKASMVYNQSNAYYFDVALPMTGTYGINISYNYAGKNYNTKTNFDLPYFTEYDEFADYSVSTLVKAISVSGGYVSENDAFDIVNDENEVRIYTVSLIIPFAIATVVLFIVDIAVRKLKWEDITSFFRTLRSKKSGKGGKN
ncbi:MAG: hypothetical protein K2G96_04290, partial [Clostridia bacterium]|nr:hypothetical protein [Clostridia bacterium]